MFDYPRADRKESTEAGLNAGLAERLPTPTPAAGALTRSEVKLLKDFVDAKPDMAPQARGNKLPCSHERSVVVRGRILGCDTGTPLAYARLECWRTDRMGVEQGRIRITADEFGQFEFETEHPFEQKVGKDVWRSSFLHFIVAAKGYKTLVTQLYFEGDPLQKHDFLFRSDLALPVEQLCVDGSPLDVVNYDLVLEPGTGVNQISSGEVI